jgi:DNA-binding IclR family transcriptional regulator
MTSVTAERVLILLRYIVDNPGGLSIREASRDLGYTPATVQRLTQALGNQGFVVQDKSTERYHLGPEAVQLGLVALSRLEMRNIARPHLEGLSRETGETAFLGIPRGNHLIYIDKALSDHPIRADVPLGANRPYNCTAVGKVLLTGFPNGELERLASEGAFERRTERSIYEVDEVRAEIERVREQGWARDDQEFQPGMGCVAAPLRNHEGQVIAALNLSGPADRMAENLDRIVEKVLAHAALVSAGIGYRGP